MFSLYNSKEIVYYIDINKHIYAITTPLTAFAISILKMAGIKPATIHIQPISTYNVFQKEARNL